MLALNIKKLSKTYKNGLKALKNIDLEVKKGQFLALLGKNGAGKTTFVEILSYLTRKTSGEVFVKGKNLDQDPTLIKSFIGIVPQEFNLAIFETVMQVLLTQAGYFGIGKNTAFKRAKKLLIDLDLWEKRDQIVIKLSGGMKRRLMVARALIHNPDIIFFDEPTAGVDIQVRKKIWNIMRDLNKQGKTIILTTHYFEEAEKLCNTLAIIDKGKMMMHGSLRSILSKYNSQKYIIEFERGQKSLINADNITYLSSRIIEISIDKKNTFTKTLQTILAQGGKIHNIQPKDTKLEKFFLKITQ
ncbi:MAG: ABC transporter ATP-binding protein [Rickettsiales bacterium]|nr:ABC transporter ATP-binding protein [Rickettsiales bacterium]